MINLVVIQGTVQEAPQQYATKTGKYFSKFSIQNVSKNGQWEQKVFLGVLCFGKAHEAAQALSPGSLVTVQGTLVAKKNEKTGKYDTSVQADKITVEAKTAAVAAPIPRADFDEDVPF